MVFRNSSFLFWTSLLFVMTSNLYGNPNTAEYLYAQDGAIEILRQRLIDDALHKQGFIPSTARYINSDFGKAGHYLEQLDENGKWADVDYLDQDNAWAPLVALDRMLVMTYAYYNKTHALHQNQALFAGIVKGLEYWYQVGPRCKNWYKNEIAKQFYFNVIALLLQDDISPSLLAKMVADLTEAPRMTGSNKILLCISVIYRGVLEKNEERIRAGIQGVKEQIRVTMGEGIQADHSFHQHGAFLYNGNYGLHFLRETTWLAAIVVGTEYAYTEAQMKVLREYYLKGTRWMIRGPLLDYNVRGRQVGRTSGFGLAADQLLPQLSHLVLADAAYRSLYIDSKTSIQKATPQNISGNRHFWRSDYTAHHRQHYFTSLKMCSKRTIGMEMDVNTENLYGYYLPYGLTYIYRRGDEYLDIFPVWDWACLPGVTSPHQAFSTKGKSTQETSFVGGVSDGKYGVSSMDLNIKQTLAKKSWFWFDKEWVALGAGITSTHEAPIVTGINQTHLQGRVEVDGKIFSGEERAFSAVNWVWHDSVAYIFPNEQKVMIKAAQQSGHLQKIFGLGVDTTYHSEVFSLWFDHGVQPEAASYAYVVLPGCSRKTAAKQSRKSPVRIISNNANIQAVYHQKLKISGIAFHEAGSFSLSQKLQVQVDRPCLLLINHRQKTVTVSDPTAGEQEIMLRITSGGREVVSKLVSLPQAELAGGSVELQW